MATNTSKTKEQWAEFWAEIGRRFAHVVVPVEDYIDPEEGRD
jgi:hypothetical protein